MVLRGSRYVDLWFLYLKYLMSTWISRINIYWMNQFVNTSVVVGLPPFTEEEKEIEGVK